MKCVPNIIYDTQNGLALDLYLPDGLTADACVIFMHGGGFHKGARDGDEVAHFAKAMTDGGLAMASISYRLNTPADTFSDKEQSYIDAYMARSQKVGLSLSPKLYGPACIAAMEDLSRAIEYLLFEGEQLGIVHHKVGIIGVSSGGIAALALSYPPTHWRERVSRPDAVVAISSAIVQPWRLEPDGPPCLMIHGPRDPIVGLSDAEMGAHRAAQIGAPVTLLNTHVPGHAPQVDLMLDGATETGLPYMQLIRDQFACLIDN